MPNPEFPRERIPENLPETQVITDIQQNPDFTNKFVVGVITAMELHHQVPTHISIIGTAEPHEGYKAWQRAENILPNHRGVLKVAFSTVQPPQVS